MHSFSCDCLPVYCFDVYILSVYASCSLVVSVVTNFLFLSIFALSPAKKEAFSMVCLKGIELVDCLHPPWVDEMLWCPCRAFPVRVSPSLLFVSLGGDDGKVEQCWND